MKTRRNSDIMISVLKVNFSSVVNVVVFIVNSLNIITALRPTTNRQHNSVDVTDIMANVLLKTQ